jgi:hypothetical protein
MAKSQGGKREGSGRKKKEEPKEIKHISTSVTGEAFDIYQSFEPRKKGYHVSRALIRYAKKQKKKE